MHGLVYKVEHDGIVLAQFGFEPGGTPKTGLFKSLLQDLQVHDDEFGCWLEEAACRCRERIRGGKAILISERSLVDIDMNLKNLDMDPLFFL